MTTTTPTPTGRATAGGSDLLLVLLEEYRRIGAEQGQRIVLRDNMVYAVILAVAAIAGGTPFGGRAVPLLLPPVCVVLGWIHLINDEKVSAIGRYIRTDLGPRIAALTGGAEVLRWETVHRSDRRRRERKALQLGVDVLVFVVPAVAALVAYWATLPTAPALIAASLAEAALTGLIAWQIAVYADLTGAEASPPRAVNPDA
jgi:hypothetical protein